MAAARTPLECTEMTMGKEKEPLECTKRVMGKEKEPLECTEMTMGKEKEPLECTETVMGDMRGLRKRLCISLAFLRTGGVSGNGTRLIIMSAYSMPQGSYDG
jgi:hypothetical protein